ncbi:McrB family protein [Isoptericola sediminis]|uniref:AAA domain-containing protein n=1 Tax=Isoptericola sediminis TaxID=2733572 RepID=A0A849K3E7_9MICO|nr:AAA family ATPase [Isoptericola sediminis]NNU27311.1 AAA domain-containing protein [Isoptericola sediminis]
MSELPSHVVETAEAGRVVLDHMLGDQRSVVDPFRVIWTAENAEKLRASIEDNLDEGSGTYYEKFEHQLAGRDRDVKLLAAEMTYLREVPLENVNPATKRKHVETILSWIPDPPSIPRQLAEGLGNRGVFHGGIGYSQSAWKHIVWLSKFVITWSGLDSAARELARSDPWAFRSVVSQVPGGVPTIRNALLYLAFPGSFEPSVNDSHRRQIRDAFAHELDATAGDDPTSIDHDLLAIRERLEAAQGGHINFYDEPYLSAWQRRAATTGERAWAVRTRPAGRELINRWVLEEFVSLAGTHLPDVAVGSDKEVVRQAVAEGYDHVDYAQRLSLTEDYFAFLTRMGEGDVVVARHDDEAWLGRITGAAEFFDDEPRLRRSVQWEPDPVAVDVLPPPVPNLLAAPARSVVELTEAVNDLAKLFDEEPDELEPEAREVPPPTGATTPALRRATEDLSWRLHMDKSWLDEYIDLLESRHQVIVHGPPGTGKTYVALRIAKHVAGDEAVRIVQFHPSYAYEDFFEGFRPRAREDGGLAFDKVPGPLREIASEAAANPGAPYVLIIDEVNRGNVAKVFGELYFLLEYRDENVYLQYSPDRPFSLPKNLFIIGTMNTADRSIALVDAAIRRRFSFIEMHPDGEPVHGLLARWLEANQRDGHRAELLAALNREIGEEDRDFKVGPSYLMRPDADTDPGMERIWRHDILPLLEEHYYGRLTRDEVEAAFGLEALRRRVASRADMSETVSAEDEAALPPER